jgi:hypothetical protein
VIVYVGRVTFVVAGEEYATGPKTIGMRANPPVVFPTVRVTEETLS